MLYTIRYWTFWMMHPSSILFSDLNLIEKQTLENILEKNIKKSFYNFLIQPNKFGLTLWEFEDYYADHFKKFVDKYVIIIQNKNLEVNNQNIIEQNNKFLQNIPINEEVEEIPKNIASTVSDNISQDLYNIHREFFIPRFEERSESNEEKNFWKTDAFSYKISKSNVTEPSEISYIRLQSNQDSMVSSANTISSTSTSASTSKLEKEFDASKYEFPVIHV